MSAVQPEKRASNASSTAPPAKPRSCVICRSRKVRCDKQAPCSNCRRAGIPCVAPSTDKPPRWAKRLEQRGILGTQSAAPGQAGHVEPEVMERIQYLESLVKDLSAQLEETNAKAAKGAGGSSGGQFPASTNADHASQAVSETDGGLHKPFGRLLLADANRSRYISSGFWSRVNDEIDGVDSDSSSDDASSEKAPTQEASRTPAQRHGFLFGHNLYSEAQDLHDYHPLPSEIPYLVEMFCENVNVAFRFVHAPTMEKILRDQRNYWNGDSTALSPANEALMFSIYYAAINSMEDEDILTKFGSHKSELNIKYRVGLEHALAKADFLNLPDLVILQALIIFVCLCRRHDSPRFVWMMTGMAIRMGLALGLQRDGSHFPNLTPYEVEMRRRAWGMLCMLDVRASEDQGTEFTIALGSSDTKPPLNIFDDDILPETKEMPPAREGITDMTFVVVICRLTEISKQLMANSIINGLSGIEEQSRLLNELYENTEQVYLRYEEKGDVKHWVGATVTRLIMAKMTLLIYLPVLFTSQSDDFADKFKTNLLIAAIEVSEYNHALNEEPGSRQWRWVYQTNSHWHAIVWMLIEVGRREWSPIAERAWTALRSPWLIPKQVDMGKNQGVWVPLKKLTMKAKQHRAKEIERLRTDPAAADRLEAEDKKISQPGSPGPFPAGSDSVKLFRQQWRRLLTDQSQTEWYSGRTSITPQPSPQSTGPAIQTPYTSTSSIGQTPVYNYTDYLRNNNLQPPHTSLPQGGFTFDQSATSQPTYGAQPMSTPWVTSDSHPWLWADTDPNSNAFGSLEQDAHDVNMDVSGGGMQWYNWVESAKALE